MIARLRRAVRVALELDPFFPSPGSRFLVPENIQLGERVSIASDCFLAADSPITIGSDTMIAARVIITTTTHDPANHPMWRQRVSRPVTIGDHVWIGAGAIILPGVSIGQGAIVGAGAVVTKNVPDFAIVAGNPARVIRERGELETGPETYPGVCVYDEPLAPDMVVRDAQPRPYSTTHSAGAP